MKKLAIVVFASLFVLPAVLRTAQLPEGPDTRLILLVAVDQFRYDYLTRFRSDYTDGIKRLLTNGAVFTNANLEHYPTVTAIGHATMLTGATPSVSGIIGNDWFDRETGATVTSVSDAAVKPLGSATGSAASPRRLLVSTVGDQLKLASLATKGTPEAPRVFGVSLKDRSAILPAGRGADAAFWWDTKTGSFVTSTYYRPDLPAWVQSFNERKLADGDVGAMWTMLSAPSRTLRQLPAERGAQLYEAIYGSPYGNELLLEFAGELLNRERLGVRNATDLLAVSFSSNDSVGHTYGPDSPQVRDIAIRTDRAIGRLLNLVDKTVGLDHTLIAFTADHGVAPLPESLRENNLPGGRMTAKELFDPIERALVSRFGEGQWLLATAGSSPYLNYDLIDKQQLDPSEVRRVAAVAAAKVPHVARVYTRDQLQRGEVPNDRIGSRVIRGFNAQRSGDLEIILEPFWIRQAQGATHGSPYNYDAHIPLILLGRRVAAGEYSDQVALNDLAPTLATLASVEIPAGSVGRVLTEALRPSSAGTRQESTPSRVLAPGAHVEKLAGDFIFTEGPTSDQEGNVYFVDQDNNRILKYDTGGTLSTFMQPSGYANGMSFGNDGRLIAGADEKNELWSIETSTRKRTVLVDAYEGKLLNGPNDIWVNPTSGRIYFTDPYYQRKWWARGPKENAEAVYVYSPSDRTLVRVIDDMAQPNGIIGTPDGNKLYVADIRGRKTFQYDIQKDGTLANKRLFVEFGSDGMTIDSDGNVYLTTGRAIQVFDRNGQPVESISVPEVPANVCFGGRDKQTLFITARTGLYAVKMRVRGVGPQ